MLRNGSVLAVGMLLVHFAAAPAPGNELVCDHGVLRWSDSGQEAALFGVNYYVPHWHN